MQNQFLSFMIELLNRLKTKKPRFFIWIQFVTAFMSAVTGIPALLIKWGVVLSPPWSTLENKFVAACSIGAFIASQLTSATPAATVTKDGAVLKQTDASALPFTAEVEVKKAQQDQIPNSSITLADLKK